MRLPKVQARDPQLVSPLRDWQAEVMVDVVRNTSEPCPHFTWEIFTGLLLEEVCPLTEVELVKHCKAVA